MAFALPAHGADARQENGAGIDDRRPADLTTPDHLEGVRLGQTRATLDRIFSLSSLVPFHKGTEKRYILDSKMPISDKVRRELDRIGAVRMEFRFRNQRLTSLRIEYGGRREIRFDEMEQKLLAIYGAPSRVQERGPLAVGRAHHVRLYLWFRIWSWEWPDRMLVVEGKHYGDHKLEELPLRHAYTYTLSRRATP